MRSQPSTPGKKVTNRNLSGAQIIIIGRYMHKRDSLCPNSSHAIGVP